jgi:mannosyltransferase
MAAYASRPTLKTLTRRAWTLRNAWITVPIGLAVLIAVSAMVRTTELGIGFWIDEGLSVGIADRPLTDIPAALRKDGSPPLYYMLLHFWLGIAGDSEEGVRAFSLACALLAIPVA